MNPVRQIEDVNAYKICKRVPQVEKKPSIWSMFVDAMYYVLLIAITAFLGFFWG